MNYDCNPSRASSELIHAYGDHVLAKNADDKRAELKSQGRCNFCLDAQLEICSLQKLARQLLASQGEALRI